MRRHPHGGAERPPAPSLRLFYALWPDELTRQRLAALQAPVIGRKVDAANLHLTLAFLGNQPSDLLPVLQDAMQTLALQPFTLNLDAYGYFSKPRVAWVGPSTPPEALLLLQKSLWQALLDRDIPLKPVAGFRPHVTLARDAERIDHELMQVIQWKAGTIALVESLSMPGGVRYRLVTSRQF